MHYKITIFGACAPYPYPYNELHRLSRKERKMTCHQNPDPDRHTLNWDKVHVSNAGYFNYHGLHIAKRTQFQGLPWPGTCRCLFLKRQDRKWIMNTPSLYILWNNTSQEKYFTTGPWIKPVNSWSLCNKFVTEPIQPNGNLNC